MSERIDHVKDLYHFPISRIQFADDYRIAYLRKDNVTAILGVSLKTGKPIDYTRYDSVARNDVQIYNEIELFKNGQLPSDHPHFNTMNFLQDFYDKEMSSKKL